MDIIAAYREAGTYRGAAEIAGTTHKTVKRVIARHEAGCRAGVGTARPQLRHRGRPGRGTRGEDIGADSAKRLLPATRAAGYAGSPRNFRRLVAAAKQAWRREHHQAGTRRCGRRVSTW